MNILLDTHTLLWFLYGNEKLTYEAKELIENENNEIAVSVVSLWEITIKIAISKLKIDSSLYDFLNLISSNGFTILDISNSDLLKLKSLPFIHRDPFDRLLIAQTINREMTILTKDEHIKQYDVSNTF